MGYFCPPGSGSGFRVRIRIHWPDWIRIRIRNPDLEVPAPANGGRYLVLESAGGLRYAPPDQIQPDQRNTVPKNNYYYGNYQYLFSVLGIRDMVVRIRIRGSVPLTNGSGSSFFLQWLKGLRVQRKRNFSIFFSYNFYLWLMDQDPDRDPGGPKTCGSCGSGSGSPTLFILLCLNVCYLKWPTIPTKIIFLRTSIW